MDAESGSGSVAWTCGHENASDVRGVLCLVVTENDACVTWSENVGMNGASESVNACVSDVNESENASSSSN